MFNMFNRIKKHFSRHGKYIWKKVFSFEYLWQFFIPGIISVIFAFGVFKIQSWKDDAKEKELQISYLKALRQELFYNTQFLKEVVWDTEKTIKASREPVRLFTRKNLSFEMTRLSCSSLAKYFETISYADRAELLRRSILLDEAFEIAKRYAITENSSRDNWESSFRERNKLGQDYIPLADRVFYDIGKQIKFSGIGEWDISADNSKVH